MVVAKTLAAQTDLVRQLQARTVASSLSRAGARRRRAQRRSSMRRSGAIRCSARRWPSSRAASPRARTSTWSSATARRRWCAAASRPGARTRSACISRRSAIRSSAIRCTAGAARRLPAALRDFPRQALHAEHARARASGHAARVRVDVAAAGGLRARCSPSIDATPNGARTMSAVARSHRAREARLARARLARAAERARLRHDAQRRRASGSMTLDLGPAHLDALDDARRAAIVANRARVARVPAFAHRCGSSRCTATTSRRSMHATLDGARARRADRGRGSHAPDRRAARGPRRRLPAGVPRRRCRQRRRRRACRLARTCRRRARGDGRRDAGRPPQPLSRLARARDRAARVRGRRRRARCVRAATIAAPRVHFVAHGAGQVAGRSARRWHAAGSPRRA